MNLLHLCLTSTYFQHNKHRHGEAKVFPVSVVGAEIVMQNIEKQALATNSETLLLWLRYVDDRITAIHKNKIDESINTSANRILSIQFN